MKCRLASSGYTIVEVLMFLIVSGAMLVSVMTLIAGRQSRTEFTATLRDFESHIQDVLNDVSTGSYPASTMGCRVNSGSGKPEANGPAGDQGTNKDCAFVGKALQFTTNDTNGQGKLNMYTIVGKRQKTGGGVGTDKEVQNLAEAVPQIIDSSEGAIDSKVLGSSLQFKKVMINGHESYGLGLISSFGQTSDLGGVVSGTANTSMIELPGPLERGNDKDAAVAAVDSLASGYSVVSSDIVICIGDEGTDGRIGAIRINGRGSEILFDNDAVTLGCNS